MIAEILANSRSHGLFAGISLQGPTLREDSDDNPAGLGTKVLLRRTLMGISQQVAVAISDFVAQWKEVFLILSAVQLSDRQRPQKPTKH